MKNIFKKKSFVVFVVEENKLIWRPELARHETAENNRDGLKQPYRPFLYHFSGSSSYHLQTQQNEFFEKIAIFWNFLLCLKFIASTLLASWHATRYFFECLKADCESVLSWLMSEGVWNGRKWENFNEVAVLEFSVSVLFSQTFVLNERILSKLAFWWALKMTLISCCWEGYLIGIGDIMFEI